MLYTLLGNALNEAREQGRLLRDARMAHYTTFRIGGPADVLLDAAGEEELACALRLAREALSLIHICLHRIPFPAGRGGLSVHFSRRCLKWTGGEVFIIPIRFIRRRPRWIHHA